MRDFFSTFLKFQQMAFEAAASVTSLMVEAQLNFLKQQYALFEMIPDYRRPDDPRTAPVNPKVRKRKARKAPSPCSGPDLKDHYGKRAHDVDVEHI